MHGPSWCTVDSALPTFSSTFFRSTATRTCNFSRPAMSHSLIRTRADEDAADLILRQAASPVLPSAATASAPATPGASAAMDSMWAEYEQYLQAARAAQEAGIDIFPHAAFVVKVSLLSERKAGQAGSARKDLLEEEERGDNDSDKLFINVCTDACVDAPEIVKQPADASTLSTALPSSDPSTAAVVPPPGSLRLPMSVGPLTPCTSHSGLPSLSVDVVIHPSTLAPPLAASHSQAAYQYAMAQAALIQRQSGTAPPVLTPAQQQTVAMRELKRTVAAFALQRIEEKYKLRVDGQAELKFPKAAYKGSLPPPAQRIRRNKDNPLHAMTPQQREESERKGKVLVQEVAHAPQSSKPAAASPAAAAPPAATAEVAASARVADTAQPATVDQASKQDPSDASQHADAQTNSSAIPAQPNQQVGAMTRSSAGVEMDTAVKIAAVTPSHTLETTNENITLQVQLPGVVSAITLHSERSADSRTTRSALRSIRNPIAPCAVCSCRALKWAPPSPPPTSASQRRRQTADPPTSCTSSSPWPWSTSACRPSSTGSNTTSRSPYPNCTSRQRQHQWSTHSSQTRWISRRRRTRQPHNFRQPSANPRCCRLVTRRRERRRQWHMTRRVAQRMAVQRRLSLIGRRG